MGKILLISLLSLIVFGCNLFVKPVKVPGFVKIDEYEFTSEYSVQGTASSRVSDAWLYIDDQLIGVFELPAEVPITDVGNKSIRVLPGIIVNGIAETRDVYNLYDGYATTGEIVPDETIIIKPTFQYLPNLNYWIEDFEDPAIKFQPDYNSNIGFSLIDSSSNENVFERRFSAYVKIDENENYFRVTSNQITGLPIGKDIYLELDYMNTTGVMIGVIAGSQGTENYFPYILLNPTTDANKEWKKVYIRLNENISSIPNAQYFKIFFESLLEEGKTEGEVFIDNVKIVYPN